MTNIFLRILNMSIAASWLVLAVLFLRLLLKKAPKWTRLLLWGIVALRLVCPFSFESVFSLIPSAETVPESVISGPTFRIQTGFQTIDYQINDYLGDHYFEGVTVPTNNGVQIMTVLAVAWLIGASVLLAYTVISYWALRRKVSTAVLRQDNIFQSENVVSPFVLGIIKPKIYLPYNMEQQAAESVIAHEQAHIQRRDHWWKLLGFLLLTIYWFNPLMWVAYILLCRDIELACDEKVIKQLDSEQRANYSQVLLACSINRGTITACPIAFGEGSVKQRIKSVLCYKKPTIMHIILAVILCAIVATCFLTNPVQGVKWGVQDIRVRHVAGKTYLELPYTYAHGGFSVRPLPLDAPEYIGDGEVPYDGALGKYRIMITFGDSDMTASFSKKFANDIYVLKNTSTEFGVFKARVRGPSDHGFVIYVGSDTPFTILEKDYGMGEEKFFGNLRIPITSADPIAVG